MSSSIPGDRQTTPQQETFGDRLAHFGSYAFGRVDHRSVHDWEGRAISGPRLTLMGQLPRQASTVVTVIIDAMVDSATAPETDASADATRLANA